MKQWNLMEFCHCVIQQCDQPLTTEGLFSFSLVRAAGYNIHMKSTQLKQSTYLIYTITSNVQIRKNTASHLYIDTNSAVLSSVCL